MTISLAALPALFAALFLCACEPPAPEVVWIPGPGFTARLDIAISANPSGPFRRDEWIELHASRSTGPWKQVRRSEVPDGVRWQRRPPEAREEHVEANVRWHVEPAGSHRFNVPGARDIHERRVRFSRPGSYRIWAESHTWTDTTVKSDTLKLNIAP